MDKRAAFCLLVAISAWPATALACVRPPRPPEPPPMDPPPPPPRIWQMQHDRTSLWIWIELGQVFQTDSDHPCSACLSLGNTTRPLPGGITVDPSLSIGRITLDADGNAIPSSFNTIPQFAAMQNLANVSAAWQAGPLFHDPTVGDPAAGASWFGFGGVIPAVTPPPLGPRDAFVICFTINFPENIEKQPVPFQIGGGLGNSDLTPFFDASSPHGAIYSWEGGHFIVPGPSSATLAVVAGVSMIRRRRGA